MFVADSYDEIQDFIKKLLIFEMNSREKTPTIKEALKLAKKIQQNHKESEHREGEGVVLPKETQEGGEK